MIWNFHHATTRSTVQCTTPWRYTKAPTTSFHENYPTHRGEKPKSSHKDMIRQPNFFHNNCKTAERHDILNNLLRKLKTKGQPNQSINGFANNANFDGEHTVGTFWYKYAFQKYFVYCTVTIKFAVELFSFLMLMWRKTNHTVNTWVNNITLNTKFLWIWNAKCFFGTWYIRNSPPENHVKLFSGIPAKPTTITLPSLTK